MVQEAALRCFAIKTGKEVVGMNATIKKMTRIMDELTYCPEIGASPVEKRAAKSTLGESNFQTIK